MVLEECAFTFGFTSTGSGDSRIGTVSTMGIEARGGTVVCSVSIFLTISSAYWYDLQDSGFEVLYDPCRTRLSLLIIPVLHLFRGHQCGSENPDGFLGCGWIVQAFVILYQVE